MYRQLTDYLKTADSEVKNIRTKKLIRLTYTAVLISCVFYAAAVITKSFSVYVFWAVSALTACILLPITIMFRHTAEEQRQNQGYFARKTIRNSFLFVLLPCLVLSIAIFLLYRPDLR